MPQLSIRFGDEFSGTSHSIDLPFLSINGSRPDGQIKKDERDLAVAFNTFSFVVVGDDVSVVEGVSLVDFSSAELVTVSSSFFNVVVVTFIGCVDVSIPTLAS